MKIKTIFSADIIILILANVIGCDSSPQQSPTIRSSSDTSIQQLDLIIEEPVAVMPVVYRTLSYDPDAVENRKQQVNVLSSVARPYIARILQSYGVKVTDLLMLDNYIDEFMPDYWSEDARGPEKLRHLTEKTGAKTILFFDVQASYSYKSATVMDYLTYQLAAPDIFGVMGYAELYNQNGEPLKALFGVAEIPAETPIEALSKSVFCIGANWLFATQVPPEPSMLKAQILPGQVVPFSEISANKALFTEAEATKVLIEKVLSFCLKTKIPGDIENKPLEITYNANRRSWYSLDTPEGPMEPIRASKACTIGLIFATYTSRTEKIVDLTPKGMSKYIAFSSSWTKKYQVKTEKARARYEQQLTQNLIENAKAKGFTIMSLPNDQVWSSGLLQDISSSVLAKKAREFNCDILICVTTRAPTDSKMTKFETSSKILDARSEKFRKDFFVSEPQNIAYKIMNSAIVPSE